MYQCIQVDLVFTAFDFICILQVVGYSIAFDTRVCLCALHSEATATMFFSMSHSQMFGAMRGLQFSESHYYIAYLPDIYPTPSHPIPPFCWKLKTLDLGRSLKLR